MNETCNTIGCVMDRGYRWHFTYSPPRCCDIVVEEILHVCEGRQGTTVAEQDVRV